MFKWGIFLPNEENVRNITLVRKMTISPTLLIRKRYKGYPSVNGGPREIAKLGILRWTVMYGVLFYVLSFDLNKFVW